MRLRLNTAGTAVLRGIHPDVLELHDVAVVLQDYRPSTRRLRVERERGAGDLDVVLDEHAVKFQNVWVDPS